jgi:acyl-coenzyme A synthetase/AMP-(fatty) acid ligase
MWSCYDGIHFIRKDVEPAKMTVNDFFGARSYCPIPMFHLIGTIFCLYSPLFFDNTAVLGPAAGPATPATADSVHVYGNVKSGVYPVSLLEDLARDPITLKNLGNLACVDYGGSPLSEWAANAISKYTNIYPGMGNTENGHWPTIQTTDPHCYVFVPHLGLEFEDVGLGKDMREAVLVRKPELALYQPVFKAFPELQKFRSKDLWQKHPSIKDGWCYVGRADDMILLSGEYRIYAATVEAKVAEHPLIRTVLIGGAGRRLPFLLIELSDTSPLSEIQEDRMLTEIWPAVEKANELCPQGVAITRKHTALVDPAKPLLRLGKMSVDRLGSLKLYHDVVEKLYV